jgi:predicted RNA-binding protein with PIN domain
MTAADDQPAPTAVPEALRVALVRFAADVLAAMEPRDVPAGLKAVQRFAPRRRAVAGAGPLWTQLGDDGFRAHVARAWSQAHPDLAERLAAGQVADEVTSPTAPVTPEEAGVPGGAAADDAAGVSPADDPLTAATGAWLLHLPVWPGLAARLAAPPPLVADAEPDRRNERLQAETDRLRAELGVAREQERAAREELAGLQRELRRLRSDADRAREEARRAAQQAGTAHDEAATALARAREEHDAAVADRAAAERERGAQRAEGKVAQQLATTRARLLLDTIVDAASGLRSELALPPVLAHPADLVAGAANQPVPAHEGSRGRSADDPALLDELLRQPHAHLVVDGYNVTKTAWPQLTLDDQRRRLVDALARVATRTGAEVTCCFDGQPGQGAVPQPRGVRVLFSVGEIADDLIRRLVRAEPPGRVVVVVTGDQAVARDVARDGARVVPSTTLLARLQRL